jgi:hypothetical protein
MALRHAAPGLSFRAGLVALQVFGTAPLAAQERSLTVPDLTDPAARTPRAQAIARYRLNRLVAVSARPTSSIRVLTGM